MATGNLGLTLAICACAWLLAAALLCLACPRRPTLYPLAARLGPAGGGTLAVIASLAVLLGGAGGRLTVFSLPRGEPIVLAATPLGAFFWLLIALPTLGLAVVRPEAELPRSPAVLANLLPLLLLALTLVDTALPFLILWALLGMTAFPLIMPGGAAIAAMPDRRRRPRRTGLPAVMAAAGACLLPAFLLLGSGCGSTRFEAVRACAPGLGMARQSLVFLCTLAGCSLMALAASRMGTFTTETRRHREETVGVGAVGRGFNRVEGAPGVALPPLLMSRIALYPLLLIAFSFLGAGLAWWGLLTVALGALFATGGAVRAARQREPAGLLTASHASQMGLILLGLGVALLVRATTASPATGGGNGIDGLAVALLCLLVGTCGGVLTWLALHRSSDEPGQRLPWDGLGLLLGTTVTLAGSLGGGWLTVQALLSVSRRSPAGYGGLALLATVILVVALALGAAAIAACVPLVSLSRPTQGVADRRERIGPRLPVLAVLAALCLLFGLAPAAALPFLRPVTRELGAAALYTTGAFGPLSPVYLARDARDALSPVVLLVCLAILTAVIHLGARAVAWGVAPRRVPRWVDGLAPDDGPDHARIALAPLIAAGGRAAWDQIRTPVGVRGGHGSTGPLARGMMRATRQIGVRVEGLRTHGRQRPWPRAFSRSSAGGLGAALGWWMAGSLVLAVILLALGQ